MRAGVRARVFAPRYWSGICADARTNPACLDKMDSRENILLIRLKSIGDILFTLPAVYVVRENFADAKLHFVVSQEHAPLLRGFPDIEGIIPFDRAVFRSKNLF